MQKSCTRNPVLSARKPVPCARKPVPSARKPGLSARTPVPYARKPVPLLLGNQSPLLKQTNNKKQSPLPLPSARKPVPFARKLVFSARKPELSGILSFKPGVGRNIVSHALPAARTLALQIYAFPVHSTSFLSNSLET